MNDTLSAPEVNDSLLLADCSPSRKAVIDPKGTPEQVIYQLCVWRCVLLNLPLPFWDITQ